MIIDTHAHVFPDAIARKATDSIRQFYGLDAGYDGTVLQLKQLSADAGIDRSWIHSVAVTPHTVRSINRFISETVQSDPDRFTGLAAIHPDAENLELLVDEVQAMHLRGFKIHPDMQRFALDSPGAMQMFAVIEGKMPILIHTGDTRYPYSHPGQMKKVAEAFPKLVCICAHLGGWNEWDDAWKALAGFENVYVDTSSSLYAMSREAARRLIRCYDRQRVLFGTDYPMWNPKRELERFLELGLTEEENERILYRNALRLAGDGNAREQE